MKILKKEVLVVLMSVMSSLTFGQQLPDSGFENWDGEKFDGNIQPKYWNFSNVEQMGVKKNFAHKTTGRSGSALKIQDQFVGVGSIGATSPGYVALGVPWAYVSGLTSIEDATAGTYGGISWSYRPDSMVVWIKRYYDSSVDKAAGDHTGDENFNLMYYAWSGTSYAPSFKAKNLSCTDISDSHKNDYCKDEESDIRQALDGNECGTKVQAKQIAEGWYYEKKAYGNWTRICIPIYYFNDDVPEKCNVILSAGNYPNFRANSGQNAGNSMDVDDIELIYSSKIQKLYINKKEWKGFNPNNTGVQTYSLGLGATEMPDIVAYRGAGSLTNNRGGKATFPGRRLNDSECVIRKGTVDGEPTTITVTAEDGSSTTTYTIKFVSQSSDNARLSDIRVNGQSLSVFTAYLTNYTVSLPYGTTQAPTVEVTTQDGSATVDIEQAGSPTGQAVIRVTAGDGTTQMTYTVSFSVAALTDVTLQGLYADGTLLPGFTPSKSNYVLSLPLGTTSAPSITWKSAYADGVQSIQLVSNTLDGGAEIRVSIPGGTASKTYKIKYKIEASTNSYLSGIALDGTSLEGFAPDKLVYTVTLPMGTTSLPNITWTAGDAWQTVKLTAGGVDGLTTIEVKAASGAVSTYRLTFKTEKSSNNALQGIALDGVDMEGFDAEVLSYTVTLPAGSTMPVITWTVGDAYQRVAFFSSDKPMTVRLTVTAGDGSTRVYKLNFEIAKSENAFLQMIYLNGQELSGFMPETYDYSQVWPEATMPKVTVKPNPGQAISIASPSGYGTVQIVVTPESGAPNTYSVELKSPDEVKLPAFPNDSFPASDNDSLAGLYIGGKAYPAFDAKKHDYTYALPWRTYQVPAVVPVAATKGQTITVAHGAVNRPTTITVTAEDGKTTQQYTVLFTAPKSSNTSLASVEIEGVDNFTFVPSKTTYKDIILPYGTTQAPSLLVERDEPEQALTITEAPLGQVSTIEVTAEDGTKATYSFSYIVAYPNEPNELKNIIVEGVGALDPKQASDFTVDLPYGTTGINIVSVMKSYPEQEVVILNGGIHEPTQIRVKSLNPAEEDKIYTITPKVYPYDPAMLTDIQVGGVSLPQFRPDVYNYVVRVTGETPKVTCTAQKGAEVDSAICAKWVKYSVETEEYQHTYMVTFFYPNDYTFDLDFENWKDYTNEEVGSRTGKVPTGWYAPINAVTSGDAGTYYPEKATQYITSTKTHGSRCAELATTYLTTSAEAMPGFLSLAQPTVSVGKWLLGYEIHSSLAFGDPISFRNTPDNVAIDYYYIESQNKANGWMFVYNANGMKQVNHAGAFSSITKNKWLTLSKPITYPDEYIPMTLDILICSAPSTTLETYYTNFGTSRSTSKMYVDNLRFSYNSSLNGITVNGKPAEQNGKTFTAEIDAEYYGTPQLVFAHAVSDQMPVVSWSEEQDGKRTATITNYAEDLSSTTYTLTVTREKSTNKQCTFVLDGKDLKIEKGSPYQTIQLATNDTAYVIHVTAEDGSDATYYAAWATAEAGSAKVTDIEADDPIKTVSTARLSVLEEEPNLNFIREHALDSVTLTVTDTCYRIHVYSMRRGGDTTYVVVRPVSDVALLKTMKTNGLAVKGFEEGTRDYTVTLPSLNLFSAEPKDPKADVRYTIVKIDEANTAVFVLVRAENGKDTTHYTVHVRTHEPSAEAYLTSIVPTPDVPMDKDFAPTTYTYTINLPADSVLRQIEAVACKGATVETNMVRADSVTFTVTSEDTKTIRTYTVNVNVLPSEVCTLSELFVGDSALVDFSEDKSVYEVELPYGTTELPRVDYYQANEHSQVDTVWTGDSLLTITVTAEDGVHTKEYKIVFTIAKSNNADLKMIMLDSVEVTGFYAGQYDYTVPLPYGADLPIVEYDEADEHSQVDTVWTGDSLLTITVTAEDGTTHTYTVTFTYLPSENALLRSIELDGVLQAGFNPEEFEYCDTVFYGRPMPLITWMVGDEQQHVDTVWVRDSLLTITVMAGDSMNISEYTLTFVHLLSPNCYLADLQLRGTTIEGFHRDSMAYSLVYPAGTDSAALAGIKDITAIPEDPDATVELKIEGTVLQIFVTAPDGSIKVYTISQSILLSTEARLKMIWLDSVEVRGFHPDTLSYTITLAQGAMLPVITAETLDTLAQWEMGMETEVENGKQVELYSMAQNGTIKTYVLTFVYANWAPSGTVDSDDYLFFYAGDGYYKAVTIGVGVQVAIYDTNGALQMIETLPVADPMDVLVETAEDGSQRLAAAHKGAAGVTFAPVQGKVYFYVFFDSKTKCIAKGGKFVLQKIK